MVLSKLPLPLNQFDRFLLHLLIVRIISFDGLKGISFSHLVNFVLAYFSMKCCFMQVNNAGIGGVVIKDSDLISIVILNRGVRLYSCREI